MNINLLLFFLKLLSTHRHLFIIYYYCYVIIIIILSIITFTKLCVSIIHIFIYQDTIRIIAVELFAGSITMNCYD